jgi:hypothetical protein
MQQQQQQQQQVVQWSMHAVRYLLMLKVLSMHTNSCAPLNVRTCCLCCQGQLKCCAEASAAAAVCVCCGVPATKQRTWSYASMPSESSSTCIRRHSTAA